MNKEILDIVVNFHGEKYIASEDFYVIIGKQPQAGPKDRITEFGRKFVTLRYFESRYYYVQITDRKFTQIMEYYTDTFGKCRMFVWVDFIKAAKLFVLRHCHWEEFKAFQEFIPYKIPEKITLGYLAEFEIPSTLAFQLARRNNQKNKKDSTFNYNCTKGFDRPVDDTI